MKLYFKTKKLRNIFPPPFQRKHSIAINQSWYKDVLVEDEVLGIVRLEISSTYCWLDCFYIYVAQRVMFYTLLVVALHKKMIWSSFAIN